MGPHEESDSVVQEWSGSELVVSSTDQTAPTDHSVNLGVGGVQGVNYNRDVDPPNTNNQWNRSTTDHRTSTYPSHRTPITTRPSPMSSDNLLGFQSYQISRTRWGRTLRTRSNRYHLQEKERQKRHVLQDMARPLKQWLIRHRGHPYPSKLEKIALALGSQMTLVQVSNWFANARRRLKNTVRGQGLTWSQRVRMYNSYVSGNAETLSIDSDDSIWDSDSEEEQANPAQEEQTGECGGQRSYNEHEEHSYFSSVPLTERDGKNTKSRKRSRAESSDNSSHDEDSQNQGSISRKRPKLHCRMGDRFMRCIHHVYPGNAVFQNGSSANECVKVSPWQKSDDEISGSGGDSSSSACSSEEYEDERYSKKIYPTQMRGNKTDDENNAFSLIDFPKSDSERQDSNGTSLHPTKYKSAILHRYLCDSTDSKRKSHKRTHYQRDNTNTRKNESLEPHNTSTNSGNNKRKRCDSEDESTDIKRPKQNCDNFSTHEREYSELEAAEVLTNLSRSSNIYKGLYATKTNNTNTSAIET